LVLFVFTACSKYDDGPLVSLRKRESRVANVWKVDKAVDLNGADSTSLYFLKKWELTNNYSVIYFVNNVKHFGRWQFTANEDNVEFVYDSLPTETYTIKRLTEDELVIKNRATDITLYLVPAN
jgi:hypothetical protein